MYASATDWDADGDYDLLAGAVSPSDEGNVWLIRKVGAASQYQFAEPEKLTSETGPISSTEGHSAPVAADWDADGDLDLILGCGDGSVVWHSNVGTRQDPQLAPQQVLVAPPKPDSDRGTAAKPCVTDWNGDGMLDLLIGDCGSQFEKDLSIDEQQLKIFAQQQQNSVLDDWSDVFQQYRSLLKSGSESQSAEDKLESKRQELVKLKELRNRCVRQADAIFSGQQTHGRVWLYRRADGDSSQ